MAASFSAWQALRRPETRAYWLNASPAKTVASNKPCFEVQALNIQRRSLCGPGRGSPFGCWTFNVGSSANSVWPPL